MIEPTHPSRAREGCIPCRVGAVGATVLCLAGSFAYAAGWLTPGHLTSSGFVDAFEANSGPHPGFRRTHAKGICVTGYFESSGNAAGLSRATVFAQGRTPVIGRLSLPGGNPSAPDADAQIRSMGLLYQLHDGQQWRTAMNSVPVNAVSTPGKFYAFLVAMRPERATGKPDPEKLKAFFAANPETQPYHAWAKAHPPSSSFANATYYSINAFRFVDTHGKEHAVRWAMVPEVPYAPVSPEQKAKVNFLDDDLNDRLASGGVRWHLIVTVAAASDKIDDATVQWPADRLAIDAGTLIIERSISQDAGPCRDINFDPLVLPNGIQPSDDPLLAARSSVYAASYQRRTREQALKSDPPNQQQNGGRP
ncbi:catalase [Burkholderia ubonensis]|uniref:catalase family peroxidase n=1 Tax=Burkholderia ubonensis TaxID=101571 RepID=UPI000752F87E|nr:catalase family peroxidase [Burkholderia ubonensis]KVD66292.1 catalase [Burkholderia ubonensis]